MRYVDNSHTRQDHLFGGRWQTFVETRLHDKKHISNVQGYTLNYPIGQPV